MRRAVILALFSLLAVAPAASARTTNVTSFDGTPIQTHFYPAEGLAAGQRAPTVLVGHGYGEEGDDDPDSSSEEIFGRIGLGPLRRAGFNTLSWDARGFGQSGGNVMVDSPEFEGRDVQALLDYVARQPEAQLDKAGDPRAGMTGASYGGGIQFATASIDKRVDALTPIIAWNSLLTSLYKDQTVKQGWGLALSGAGGAAYAGGLPGGQTGSQDPQIQAALIEGTTTGKFSDSTVAFFGARGPRQFLSKVRVPTFIAEGTVDTLFTLKESMENYKILQRQGTPVRMMWFCGGHGACLGNNGPDRRIEGAVIAWLRRYVKRERSVKLPPEFQWLADNEGSYRTSQVFPPPARAPLRGSGSGLLTLQPGASAQGAFIAASPATDAVNVAISPPARAVDVLGEPRVRITYSGTASPADTRLYAQVLDRRTGRVVGNQVVPVPVVLDGAQHTVERTLEPIATRADAGSQYVVQVAAGTSVYDRQRSTGAVTLSRVEAQLPVVDVSALPALRSSRPFGLARAGARRAARVRVRAVNDTVSKSVARLYHRRRSAGRMRWVRVGSSSGFTATTSTRRVSLRVGGALRAGTYEVRVAGRDRYGRRLTASARARLSRRAAAGTGPLSLTG
jgi:ABC-2 type transport system ATP-binding protein